MCITYIYDAVCGITTFDEFKSRIYGTEIQGCHLADIRKNTPFAFMFNMSVQVLQFSGGSFQNWTSWTCQGQFKV